MIHQYHEVGLRNTHIFVKYYAEAQSRSDCYDAWLTQSYILSDHINKFSIEYLITKKPKYKPKIQVPVTNVNKVTADSKKRGRGGGDIEFKKGLPPKFYTPTEKPINKFIWTHINYQKRVY